MPFSKGVCACNNIAANLGWSPSFEAFDPKGVILPDSLIEAFTALKWCADRHSPLLNQMILAEFMDSPLFAKHLKRSRKVYSKRHDVLINALNKHFADDVTVQGTNAGIHLLAWLNRRNQLLRFARDRYVR